MTAESEMRRDSRPTRRGVLLGVGLAGLGGTLAGCSTAAVPYGANEAGQVPGSAPTSSAMAMPATGSPGSASSGSAMPSGPADPKAKGRSSATAAGKVLAAASEIPVGGGRIFAADKVVVTQPARGQYRGFSAVCTHVGCILDKVANGVIGCPCHGGEFKITDGTVVAGPPPTPLARERIKIIDGKVVLL
jgi:Rieske Fe-S protein